MNKFSRNQIVIALLLVTATLLLASWYVQEKQEDYRTAVTVKLAEQETTMVRFSELLDRDSVDTVVNQVIQDCAITERERFDSLLSSLSQLGRTELLEIDQLFDACGSYFADRQAILAIRFAREVELYSEYLALLALTDTDSQTYEAKHVKWRELSDLERQKSQLTTELVTIQGEIITLLIAGEATNSESITERLDAAQTAKDSLVVLGTQTDSLRAEISNL